MAAADLGDGEPVQRREVLRDSPRARRPAPCPCSRGRRRTGSSRDARRAGSSSGCRRGSSASGRAAGRRGRAAAERRSGARGPERAPPRAASSTSSLEHGAARSRVARRDERLGLEQPRATRPAHEPGASAVRSARSSSAAARCASPRASATRAPGLGRGGVRLHCSHTAERAPRRGRARPPATSASTADRHVRRIAEPLVARDLLPERGGLVEPPERERDADAGRRVVDQVLDLLAAQRRQHARRPRRRDPARAARRRSRPGPPLELRRAAGAVSLAPPRAMLECVPRLAGASAAQERQSSNRPICIGWNGLRSRRSSAPSSPPTGTCARVQTSLCDDVDRDRAPSRRREPRRRTPRSGRAPASARRAPPARSRGTSFAHVRSQRRARRLRDRDRAARRRRSPRELEGEHVHPRDAEQAIARSADGPSGSSARAQLVLAQRAARARRSPSTPCRARAGSAGTSSARRARARRSPSGSSWTRRRGVAVRASAAGRSGSGARVLELVEVRQHALEQLGRLVERERALGFVGRREARGHGALGHARARAGAARPRPAARPRAASAAAARSCSRCRRGRTVSL